MDASCESGGDTMKRILIVCSLVLLFAAADFDIRFHTLNQWEIAISNWGKIGQNMYQSAGAFWPIGSGHNYIFGSGIWIGGVIPNGDTVVTIGYDPHSAAGEFAPGPAYSDPDDDQWHVYFSTDVVYPFHVYSLQDGYAIYNDFDTAFHMYDSFHVPEPLGVTIEQRSYIFPVSWSDDAVIFRFIIHNDTTHAIRDLYTGWCVDFDIGNEAGTGNDRCHVDLPRKMFYGWQDVIEPTPPPAWWPGAFGIKMLSPCSVAAFKRFTLALEPAWDRERYLTLAGYNFQTGAYEPYDTIIPDPDDQRVLISAGPFDSLVPGDSIVLDYVILVALDSLPIPPIPYLNNKADRAQASYNMGWHVCDVTHPTASENKIHGLYRIGYKAQSVSGYPMLCNFYLFSEHGLDTIASEIEYYGGYDWFTDSFPDCGFGRLIVIAYDSVTMGCGISDAYFAIDNPGDAPPYLNTLYPYNGQTLSGDVEITWAARDPEWLDSLLINIYVKTEFDTTFQSVALNEPNDSTFMWNTQQYRNGQALLMLETQDSSSVVADTIQVYLQNHVSGGAMNHITGLNNVLDMEVLIHQPQNITGHTYELSFLEYEMMPDTGFFNYYPIYIYVIHDSNTGVTVLDTYSLGHAYYDYGTLADYSPIIDGFSMWSRTDGSIITQTCYRSDSVKVIIGSYPEDSLFIGYRPNIWWAYRGSQLQFDWVTHTNGGLTLNITDLNYGDTIPYMPYSWTGNQHNAFGWCFQYHIVINDPSDTLRSTDHFIYFCGNYIDFSRNVPSPVPGDRWIVYPGQYSPPIKGNVYRFTPVAPAGVEQNTHTSLIAFQVFPVPCVRRMTIQYSLPVPQKVKLVMYDVAGRQVKEFENGTIEPGMHTIQWNGRDDRGRKVASGVYFCRLEVGEDFHKTEKIILLK